QQLDDQGRTFLRDPTKNRVESAARTLYLSKIFDWFRGDFERAAGSLPAFIAPYLHDGVVIPPDARIEFLDYDWRLNDPAVPSRTPIARSERAPPVHPAARLHDARPTVGSCRGAVPASVQRAARRSPCDLPDGDRVIPETADSTERAQHHGHATASDMHARDAGTPLAPGVPPHAALISSTAHRPPRNRRGHRAGRGASGERRQRPRLHRRVSSG